MAPNVEVRRNSWKDYRSHRAKNTKWILPQLVAEGARQLDDFRVATDPTEEHTALLDQVKQIGFYTDCLGNAHWSEPSKVIDCELAHSLVAVAELLAKSREITTKEVELWIEHMRPAYGTPLDWMKTALENWYAAMRDHNLDSEDMDNVKQFIWGEHKRS